MARRTGGTEADRTSLAGLAAATPASRERYIDLLRALSIGVVVLGHWLIAVVVWRDGHASGQNALAVVPGLWLATWVLQVMPLFFFVGGYSNLVSFDSAARRGGGYARFLTGRVARLMRPTAVFIGVWLTAAVALDAAGLPPDMLGPMTAVVARPLWFLGIYLIVVALAPAMIRLHRRYGVAAVVALGAGAAVVDVARLAFGLPLIGYANFALVWLFAHQLGFLYADGTFARCSRRSFKVMAGTGLVGLVALTGSGLYPGSMVGLPGDPASNMDPPSVCILALTLWLVGLAMLLRDRATRWLSGKHAWAAVIGFNSVIMTMFLWHLTAMLIAIGVLYPMGFPQPEAGTAAWWALRPVWLAGLAAALVPLVGIFGRFERPRLSGGGDRAPVREGAGPCEIARPPAGAGTAAAVAGGALVTVGVLGFAVAGFAPSGEGMLVLLPVGPLPSLLALVAGSALLRGFEEDREVRPLDMHHHAPTRVEKGSWNER